jgi:hypothetical protein
MVSNRNLARIISIGTFILGSILFFFCAAHTDVVVDVEYISALLTASSIVFGFWVSIFTLRASREEDIKGKIPFIKVSGLLLSFLSISIVVVVLSAVGVLPSTVALGVVAFNFLYNITNLACYFLLGIDWSNRQQ